MRGVINFEMRAFLFATCITRRWFFVGEDDAFLAFDVGLTLFVRDMIE